MDLEASRVLLTGAFTGLGLELARALAHAGAHLAITARRGPQLERLAGVIERTSGLKPLVLPADLSRRGEAKSLAERALRGLGGIEVLINNAANGVGGSQWLVGDDQLARDAFETNYFSPLALIQELVPRMREQRRGAVVNVSSIGIVTPMPLTGHLYATKAALSLCSEVLRQELRDSGVMVLHVLPGPIKTGGFIEFAQVPGVRDVVKSIPLGDPAVLARRIVNALKNNRTMVIYPALGRLMRHFPNLSLRISARLGRGIDLSGDVIIKGGSTGDFREVREQFEREQITALAEH